MAKCSPARKERLRERARMAQADERRICTALRIQGSQCSVCQHKGWRMEAKLVCELDSDFQGYRLVEPDYVCSRFENEK